SLSSPFFFSPPGTHTDLHSFPTRRSSDLDDRALTLHQPRHRGHRADAPGIRQHDRGAAELVRRQLPGAGFCDQRFVLIAEGDKRSEEHTSELQSPYDLVCRLLLEKKKKNI